jgi:hypothetical protein
MQTADRYRLAIAAIEPSRLVDAVSDLAVNGLTSADLCLAAAPEALDAVRQSMPPSSRTLLAPLLDTEPLAFVSQQEVAATAHRPMTAQMNGGALASPVSGPRACWLDAVSCATLLNLMAHGEVVVIAGPLSAAQLRAGTQVLLKHSNHPVQGHLLIAPGNGPR